MQRRHANVPTMDPAANILTRKKFYFTLKIAETLSSKRARPMPECPQRKKFSQKTPKASRVATVTSYNSGLNVTEQRDGPK
ncbi:hypothetical protein GCM10007388_07450 [Pseudoduganella plicata]|uniref:Uncharacterized protein n=1 Tax=Pseudoduganella plicata TaxID=321984 RepID=A0AA87Y274_9BURK|nr:hypothetical protein GCM10007388_07450 [Pseudoduganella plicata]